MKAVQIGGYDAEPVLVEIDRPQPGPGEVLVRVTAAALNPLDVKLQRGYMVQFFPLTFPYTLGTDLAGIIERLGTDVEGWAVGDRVIARTDPTAGGGLAEFAVVPAGYLAKAPSSVALDDAAGIGTAAATAWQALTENGSLMPGQTLLVQAGAGGVGSFAVQFARDAGLRVVATASGEGVGVARQLGADQVIDYRSVDFAQELAGLDLVLDTVGPETEQRSYKVLRSGGRLLATAQPPDDEMAKAHNVDAAFVFHSSDGERLRRVVEAIDGRGIKVLLDRKVPLGKYAEAFAHQATGRARGKIILLVE